MDFYIDIQLLGKRMADEAEKLINLSLCKMAESRTIRRGGTSLHKHLLISTVLTKARSAYFETWYMGEGEAIDSRTGRPIDLNTSYQGLEFPLDEDDDDDDDDDNDSDQLDLADSSTSYLEQVSNPGPTTEVSSSSSSSDLNSAIIDVNSKNLIDPRYFVEVGTENESEIDLPSDILNCVEKMGDISDMSFGVDDSASSTASSQTVVVSANNVVVVHTSNNNNNNNVLIESCGSNPLQSDHDQHHRHHNLPSQQSTQLVYLDLDSTGYATERTTEHQSDVNHHLHHQPSPPDTSALDSDEEPVFGSPSHTSTPRPNASKRRRNWGLEEELDDDDETTENNEEDSTRQSALFPPYSDEIRSSAAAANKRNLVSKRLRFSPTNEDDEDDSGVSNMSFLPSSLLPTVEEFASSSSSSITIAMSNEFRTKKSHFEEDEQEEPEDDPFLGDALLGQNLYDPDSDQLLQRRKNDQREKIKNDQRVPSASGGSSSDEDGDQGESESCMEVDQITNLVQIISFNKPQPSQQHVHSPMFLPSSSSSSSAAAAVTTCSISTSSSHSSETLTSSSSSSPSLLQQQSSSSHLVRSMSSPDLCGLASSSKFVSSTSTNNAKDIDIFTFSSRSGNGNHNNSNNPTISHRVLTMTV
ncbi:dentin sialophosphoprotein isoform X1 [Folsomia candida]|nr:dentin sialophosphoprotein isoform X1 [Folsomia candida]